MSSLFTPPNTDPGRQQALIDRLKALTGAPLISLSASLTDVLLEAMWIAHKSGQHLDVSQAALSPVFARAWSRAKSLADAPAFSSTTPMADATPLTLSFSNRPLPIAAATVFAIGPLFALAWPVARAHTAPSEVLNAKLVADALNAVTPVALAGLDAAYAHKEEAITGLVRDLETALPELSATRTDDGLILTENVEGALVGFLARSGYGDQICNHQLHLTLQDPAAVNEARAVLGLAAAATGRAATIRRTTKETDIFVSLNLDAPAKATISTGLPFFDHMLEQISRHADIALQVNCEGDLEVDAHHTIEDVCLAVGQALREALGDRKGAARYGFALPMDEARASAWIDLSGRAYSRFDGTIPGTDVAGFPVEMCAHAFRSFAESLQAAVHIEVSGENAHHMIEACFKAFARALRQAKALIGTDIASTKGVLA